MAPTLYDQTLEVRNMGSYPMFLIGPFQATAPSQQEFGALEQLLRNLPPLQLRVVRIDFGIASPREDRGISPDAGDFVSITCNFDTEDSDSEDVLELLLAVVITWMDCRQTILELGGR